MIKKLLALSAAPVALFASVSAHAATNMGTLAANVQQSIANVPGLLTAVCYIFGVILVILGILKLKEHVEKPDQTPLKEAFIRLVIGGALFALPLLTTVAFNTVDNASGATGAVTAKVKAVEFGVTP